MRVGPDLVLLADVWREWKVEKDKKENMVEAGLLRAAFDVGALFAPQPLAQLAPADPSGLARGR